jgi:hypothetical protein
MTAPRLILPCSGGGGDRGASSTVLPYVGVAIRGCRGQLSWPRRLQAAKAPAALPCPALLCCATAHSAAAYV